MTRLATSACYLLVAAFLALMVGLLFVPESVIPPVQVTRWIVGAEFVALLGIIELLRRNAL